ncbi:MAG: GntP family permease [Rhodospirillales bacterium]|nr:MAG: GntP family permease [Rhodospirillales bacterium]
MMDILAVLIALAFLIFFAFRGVSLIILAPLAALIAALLSGTMPLLGAYTQIFMRGTGEFIISFFPLFLLGAIFGKLMDDSGSAKAIAETVSAKLGAERSIISVVLCCAVLTYGGVSAFVVAFAIYPIAAALFRAADIPKRLIPGALALGAFTFTMSALPGTPAIQNAIPMPFFGTTAFAAPGLGIIAGIIMFVLGSAWLSRRAATARAAGEGYGQHEDSLPKRDVAMRERAQDKGFDLNELPEAPVEKADLPSFPVAVMPVVVVILANFAFIQLLVPMMDTTFLAEPQFGATTIESVRGVWAVIVGLSLAIVLLIACNWRRLADLRESIDKGTDASVLPIFNTASLVGFGAVAAALPAFDLLSEAVLSVGAGNPLISLAAGVTVLSAITGSASGGMTIALENLGQIYVTMAEAAGVSMDAMHRVAALASGALDSLPHNGAVITLLAVCKLTHRESYFDVFMVSVVGQMIALIVLIVLASVFGAF